MKFMLTKSRLQAYQHMGKDRKFLNRSFCTLFKKKSIENLSECAKKRFFELEHGHNYLHGKSVVKQLREHQTKNGEIIFVSGSFLACLQPLANKFDIKYVLATTLEKQGSCYNGNIRAPQVSGDGKLVAMERFLQTPNDSHTSGYYAYSDHVSDIPILKYVGHSIVIVDGPLLTAHAKNNKWYVMENT